MSKVNSREGSQISRLRAIAAELEKVAIFVAVAVLTYALIAIDTRAAEPRATSADKEYVVQGSFGFELAASGKVSKPRALMGIPADLRPNLRANLLISADRSAGKRDHFPRATRVRIQP